MSRQSAWAVIIAHSVTQKLLTSNRLAPDFFLKCGASRSPGFTVFQCPRSVEPHTLFQFPSEHFPNGALSRLQLASPHRVWSVEHRILADLLAGQMLFSRDIKLGYIPGTDFYDYR